jgi:hypothetical protein
MIFTEQLHVTMSFKVSALHAVLLFASARVAAQRGVHSSEPTYAPVGVVPETEPEVSPSGIRPTNDHASSGGESPKMIE